MVNKGDEHVLHKHTLLLLGCTPANVCTRRSARGRICTTGIGIHDEVCEWLREWLRVGLLWERRRVKVVCMC